MCRAINKLKRLLRRAEQIRAEQHPVIHPKLSSLSFCCTALPRVIPTPLYVLRLTLSPAPALTLALTLPLHLPTRPPLTSHVSFTLITIPGTSCWWQCSQSSTLQMEPLPDTVLVVACDHFAVAHTVAVAVSRLVGVVFFVLFIFSARAL